MEKTENFPLKVRSSYKKDVHSFHLYSTLSKGNQASKRNKIKSNQTGNEIKLSLLANDMIFYVENLKESAKKIIRVNKFIKVAEYKSIYKSHSYQYTKDLLCGKSKRIC